MFKSNGAFVKLYFQATDIIRFIFPNRNKNQICNLSVIGDHLNFVVLINPIFNNRHALAIDDLIGTLDVA